MLHETLELRGFPQSQCRRLEWCYDVRCFDLTPGSGTEWLRRVHDGPDSILVIANHRPPPQPCQDFSSGFVCNPMLSLLSPAYTSITSYNSSKATSSRPARFTASL